MVAAASIHLCAPALQQGLMPDIITRACLLRAVTFATLTHGSCSRVEIIALRCGSRRFAVTRKIGVRDHWCIFGPPILTELGIFVGNRPLRILVERPSLCGAL